MTTKTEALVSRVVPDMDEESLLGSFPEGPRLIGTRCDNCGRTMIGSRIVCSSCVSTAVTRVALPATGILYTFTRLHVGAEGVVRPLGYVDLDDDVRTLADIREGDVTLVPGIRVELGVDGDDWFFARVAD